MEEEKLEGIEAFKMDLYFWLQAFVMVLVTIILVFTLVGRIIGVEGSSMVPTLHDRDMLILQSLGYKPRQGDVVVLTKYFSTVQSPIVKRVIAVGGQSVDIDYNAGEVRVDGEVLSEPYINGEAMFPPAYENETHIEVPEGSIFVMGDNRNHSADSRDVDLGTVDERYVLGRAVFTLYSKYKTFGPIH